MPQYICPKLRSGKVKFEIDWGNQQLALREDYPARGESGASFSDNEWVSFDAINAKLRNGLANSAAFADCFNSHSSDNSTMLCAVLLSLGCIDDDYNTETLLTRDLQNSYDKKNPPENP